jgi:hypothetical protein
MKTLGRILIILVAFAIMMGITYSTVNASGSSTNTSAFQRSSESFDPNGGRQEFRDGSLSGSGVGMMFGLLRNTFIVAIIVALIAFPKNLLQQRRRAVPVRIE